MKDSTWKALSLVTTSALIVVVASWATAQTGIAAETGSRGGVTVEADKQRYVLAIGAATHKEADKYILYDSWDFANTREAWVLLDPHKPRSKWKAIEFEK